VTFLTGPFLQAVFQLSQQAVFLNCLLAVFLFCLQAVFQLCQRAAYLLSVCHRSTVQQLPQRQWLAPLVM
jgi:hypothetical protein